MSICRPRIVQDYAKWTALSALRSGAPIKSRADIYPLLDNAGFATVLEGEAPIDEIQFNAWHQHATQTMCERERRLGVGWATKLLNVYLKTAGYVGGMGRPGLASVLHPPIDAGLWAGIQARFGHREDIVGASPYFTRIKSIDGYEAYARIIAGCRIAAREMGCSLIEVEQLWEGAATPDRATGLIAR